MERTGIRHPAHAATAARAANKLAIVFLRNFFNVFFLFRSPYTVSTGTESPIVVSASSPREYPLHALFTYVSLVGSLVAQFVRLNFDFSQTTDTISQRSRVTRLPV